MAIAATIFRPYSSSDSLRSDRSAGDRQRHRQKVRESIRNNIADLLAEESIIGKDKDKIVKVPIRGIKEYRFIYGENTPGVGQGDGNAQRGQVVGKRGEQGPGQGQPQAGDQAGADYYETDVNLEELIEIMFEDLELPDMERKILREVLSERLHKRKGYRKAGIRIRLDKRQTAISRIKRKIAASQATEDPAASRLTEEEERFPFNKRDMIYRHFTEDVRPDSNAAVICIMDTSGSMDTVKKYLARSFFFLLYQFVSTKYQHVELVFVAHHSEAKEVTEEEFFHKGESGGTLISSGYNKALEIIRDRYHPSLWNIYAFHCSDGDNFSSDNPATLAAARELCAMCNLFGYGEIKPTGFSSYESSMIGLFRELWADNFKAVVIAGKEYLWPCFREFLTRERIKASTAAA